MIGPLTYSVFERHYHPNPRGSGGTYSYTGVAASSTTSAMIGGLAGGSVHTYVVRASAAGVTSGYSQTVTVTTPRPQPPTNLRVTGLTVVNPVPTPALLSDIAPSESGGFQFTVQASAVQTTLIQATTNLVDPTSWTTMGTILPTNTTFIFTDTNASQFHLRFYRVISP